MHRSLSEILIRIRHHAALLHPIPLQHQHTSSLHPSWTNATASRNPGHASPPLRTPSSRVKLQVSIKDLLVTADESGMRLDQFLEHRLERDPELHSIPINNTLINKWLRKRLVKLLPTAAATNDSATAGHSPMATVTTGTVRTEEGQLWRVRVLQETSPSTTTTTPTASASKDGIVHRPGSGNLVQQRDIQTIGQPCLPLLDWIVYKDERIILLNKPAGVAVQGGSGVQTSIDGSLSVLQEGFPDRPRLVHRLDRTTSGLLILARTRKAAQELTKRFHDGTTGAAVSDDDDGGEEGPESGLQKMYIAIVESTDSRPIVGKMCPHMDEDGDPPKDGLSRLSGHMAFVKQGKQERIEIQKADTDGSEGPVWPSVTDFCIASQSVYKGTCCSVLRLYPRTGRKHQLRVHCAQLLKAPILGDKKYSGDGKTIQTADRSTGRIHLHMAKVALKGWIKDDKGSFDTVEQRPEKQRNFRIQPDGTLIVRAPLPDDMKRTMQRLGLHYE
ncbi:unnamed protein product [Mortierella alpina]